MGSFESGIILKTKRVVLADIFNKISLEFVTWTTDGIGLVEISWNCGAARRRGVKARESFLLTESPSLIHWSRHCESLVSVLASSMESKHRTCEKTSWQNTEKASTRCSLRPTLHHEAWIFRTSR